MPVLWSVLLYLQLFFFGIMKESPKFGLFYFQVILFIYLFIVQIGDGVFESGTSWQYDP